MERDGGAVVMVLPVHILAGALVLATGYVAIFAAKGATLHRKAGMFFVYAMVTSSTTGVVMAASGAIRPELNILTALLTSYLAITGMMTVSARATWSHRFEVGAMLLAFSMALGSFVLAARFAGGQAQLMIPTVIFGTVSLIAGIGDRRLVLGGALAGKARLQRHLWRMCIALFISALALVSGRVPKSLRVPALEILGVIVPLASIVYWKWRLRTRPPVFRPSTLDFEFANWPDLDAALSRRRDP